MEGGYFSDWISVVGCILIKFDVLIGYMLFLV